MATRPVVRRGGEPLVLTLAAHDRLYAHGTFAAAVERLSHGSIRIEFRNDWRDSEADYERGTIEDVRNGRVQLAIVGVRVWDTMGITGFQALLAPLLVDSLALERRLLERELVTRALEGIREAEVVGLAVLPGTLRRPLGFTRAWLGQRLPGRDVRYQARRRGRDDCRRGRGAPDGYAPGDVSMLDGAELDLTTLSDNGYDEQARAFAANVVLWPASRR